MNFIEINLAPQSVIMTSDIQIKTLFWSKITGGMVKYLISDTAGKIPGVEISADWS